jgi:hypothetical protein
MPAMLIGKAVMYTEKDDVALLVLCNETERAKEMKLTRKSSTPI